MNKKCFNAKKELQYSIVTTVYNDNEDVIKLIKNIEQQSLLPVEMIVVDGGSKDNTVEIVKRYCQYCKFDLKVVSGKRLNIAQGFNCGIKQAVCDYIGIVACGNHYPCDFFEVLMGDFQKDERLYAAYGAIRGVSNTIFGQKYTQIYMGNNDYFMEKFPTNHGNLCKKDLFNKEGYFYEKFQYAGEDQEFFVKIKNLNYKVYGNEDVIIDWEVPDSFYAYRKQQRGYIVSDMEMFDNKTLFKIYKKKVEYVIMWIAMVVFFLIPQMRILGAILLLWILYRMIKNLIKYDYMYVFVYNLAQFIPVIEIVRNFRFLFKKNKIEHILDSYY